MKLAIRSCLVLTFVFAAVARADLTASLKDAASDIKSAGPLAFAGDGVLFVGDAQQGAIYAVATGDTSGDAAKAKVDVKGVDKQIAAMLGVTPGDILINDIAVNPASGNVYLSVSRGRGADAAPVLIRVDGQGKLSDVKLTELKSAKVKLNNAIAPGGKNPSITDLAYVDGKVIVAGMSNEEFASKLHVVEFPFKQANRGASVEIYHGAHGKVETRSPVRTFVTMNVGGTSTVVAAYTCTPLVTFPLASLKDGEKVTGKTVAELGNRNTPLDIITYTKGGKEYLLVTNTSHGVLKLSTDGISEVPAIQSKINGTAGLKAEKIGDLANVKQLDKLNGEGAVILVAADGVSELRTVALP